MKNTNSFTVKIHVRPEQIEMLKAVLAWSNKRDEEDGDKPTFTDWKDYGRTTAVIGFGERLQKRFEELKATGEA